MIGRQAGKETTFTHSIPHLQEEFIAANSDEKGDNNSFFKSAIDNNHLLSH